MKRRATLGHLASIALLGLGCVSWTSRAFAYCPATTCDPTKPAQHCKIDGITQCVISGVPLAWRNGCVTVNVQADGAPKARIAPSVTAELVQQAFDTWLSVDCGGGQTPSLNVVVGGPVACASPEYSMAHHNANVVMFREDSWPYVAGADALGITHLNFDADLGDLWDADIELNAVDEPLSTDPSDDEVDLASLITHEVGHLLGLSHTLEEGATMQAGYHRGSTELRSLSVDDITGICALYPPGREIESQSCEPRHGFSDLCAADQGPFVEPEPEDETDDAPPTKSSSCALAPTQSGGLALPLLLTVATAVSLFRRRR